MYLKGRNFGGNLILWMEEKINFGRKLIWRILAKSFKSAKFSFHQNFFFLGILLKSWETEASPASPLPPGLLQYLKSQRSRRFFSLLVKSLGFSFIFLKFPTLQCIFSFVTFIFLKNIALRVRAYPSILFNP